MSETKFETKLYHKLFSILERDLSGEFPNEDNILDEIDDNGDGQKINPALQEEIDELLKIEDEAYNSGLQKDLLDYSQITKYFYNQSSEKDYFPGISKLKEYILKNQNKKILLKLLKHAELAIVQKVSLSDRINDLEAQLARTFVSGGALSDKDKKDIKE